MDNTLHKVFQVNESESEKKVRVKVNVKIKVKENLKVKIGDVMHTVATNAPYFGCVQMMKINSTLQHCHHYHHTPCHHHHQHTPCCHHN